MTAPLPVAVIGGGPVGLAAASHLILRGIPVRLYETGDKVAANVRDWGHVRLFSPWSLNVDEAAAAILKRHGWQQPPADALPTGDDLYDAYLAPLAETPELGAVVETQAKVTAIARQGIDKVVSRRRGEHPFALTVVNGATRTELARAVIDASGTWQNPNPLGATGLPAPGEAELSAFIAYGIPDILRSDRATYAGRRVLVIGGGHSAANALLDLARLAENDRNIEITWAVRSDNLARVFGGGDADQLSARGKLGSDLRTLIESGRLRLVGGFSAERAQREGDGVGIAGRTAAGTRILGPFDRVIVATGQRPDLSLTRELRLDLDPWLESSRALGPSIDPNLHSCGSVPPHGYRELTHPEPDFFTVGVKSYGRAPTFLMATGYEQVRSVVAHLAGDSKAADEVRLVLPETGVCTSDFAAPNEAARGGCCGGPAPDAQSCCAADAEAKAVGASGCGCSSRGETAPESKGNLESDTACCGGTHVHA